MGTQGLNRRLWLRQLLILTGGTVLFSSCWDQKGKVTNDFTAINLSQKGEDYFSDIVNAIIPESEISGASALQLDKFVLKMFEECYDESQQKQLQKGFEQLSDYLSELGSENITLEKQEEFVTNMWKKEFQREMKYLLQETRYWVKKGYENSEYFMTKVRPYEMVPGRFYGCVKTISYT